MIARHSGSTSDTVAGRPSRCSATVAAMDQKLSPAVTVQVLAAGGEAVDGDVAGEGAAGGGAVVDGGAVVVVVGGAVVVVVAIVVAGSIVDPPVVVLVGGWVVAGAGVVSVTTKGPAAGAVVDVGTVVELAGDPALAPEASGAVTGSPLPQAARSATASAMITIQRVPRMRRLPCHTSCPPASPSCAGPPGREAARSAGSAAASRPSPRAAGRTPPDRRGTTAGRPSSPRTARRRRV